MWKRAAGWRFWALVGVAVLDGLLFVVPLVPVALVMAAIVAPDGLRQAARFLEALAEGR